VAMTTLTMQGEKRVEMFKDGSNELRWANQLCCRGSATGDHRPGFRRRTEGQFFLIA